MLILTLGIAVFGGLFVSVSVGAVTSGNNNCGVNTSIITCPATTDNAGTTDNTAVWVLLKIIINILTGGIGLVAIAGIVYGSILYTSAAGNPEQVKKAMGIFTNVVIGIVAYVLMYAVLNFIVPGGLFG